MKHKFIPLEKLSKRKQKEHHAKQRRDWGNFNPVTKKAENGKAYNRKKSKQRYCEDEPCLDFLFLKKGLESEPHCIVHVVRKITRCVSCMDYDIIDGRIRIAST